MCAAPSDPGSIRRVLRSYTRRPEWILAISLIFGLGVLAVLVGPPLGSTQVFDEHAFAREFEVREAVLAEYGDPSICLLGRTDEMPDECDPVRRAAFMTTNYFWRPITLELVLIAFAAAIAAFGVQVGLILSFRAIRQPPRSR